MLLPDVARERRRQQELQLPRQTTGRALRGRAGNLIHRDARPAATLQPEPEPLLGIGRGSVLPAGQNGGLLRQPWSDPQVLRGGRRRASPRASPYTLSSRWSRPTDSSSSGTFVLLRFRCSALAMVFIVFLAARALRQLRNLSTCTKFFMTFPV